MRYTILLLLLTGCFTRPVNVSLFPAKKIVNPGLTGIPNFGVVDLDKDIYRGGQPTKEQFKLIKQQDPEITILKLNTETEGSDADAELLGLKVVKIPIPTKNQIFGPVPVQQIKDFWKQHPSHVYVHCEHGQDRTGLAVYLNERMNGWSQEDAEIEADSYGFHWELLGLYKAMENN